MLGAQAFRPDHLRNHQERGVFGNLRFVSQQGFDLGRFKTEIRDRCGDKFIRASPRATTFGFIIGKEVNAALKGVADGTDVKNVVDSLF